MITKVTVETTNRPGEKLALTFTNRKAAKDFYYAAIKRDDVVDVCASGNEYTTYPNVAKAIDALDFWAK
jgi:hypothetical protein